MSGSAIRASGGPPAAGDLVIKATAADDAPVPIPPYALVVATKRGEALRAARAVATGALGRRRLHVVAGDRGGQFFPTDEIHGTLRRYYNRGRSSGDPSERVQRVALVFYRFFPRAGSAVTTVVANEMAARAGYLPEDVEVVFVDTVADLHAALDRLQMCDVAVEREPATFLEALELFAAGAADARVSAMARAHAREWQYPKPADILRDLRVVHRVYGQLRAKDGSALKLRDRKSALQDETGLILGYEDSGVIAQYRTAAFDELDGRVVPYPLHAKYAHAYTRIYFWFASGSDREQEAVKTLVADAGPHGKTGSRNDR